MNWKAANWVSPGLKQPAKRSESRRGSQIYSGHFAARGENDSATVLTQGEAATVGAAACNSADEVAIFPSNHEPSGSVGDTVS